MQFNRTLLVCGCTVLFLLIIFVPSANTKKGKRKKPKGKKITYFFVHFYFDDFYLFNLSRYLRKLSSRLEENRRLFNEAPGLKSSADQ